MMGRRTTTKAAAPPPKTKVSSKKKKSTTKAAPPPKEEEPEQEEPATETTMPTATPDTESETEMADAPQEDEELPEEVPSKLLDREVDLTVGGGTKRLSSLLDDEDIDCIGFVVYPKASTPGCTKQVKTFNSKIEEFRQLGVQLVGLSLDKMEAQKKFVESQDLDFPLVGSGAAALLEALNCLSGGKISRSVVVVDTHSNVFYEKHKVKPEESCTELLKFLKERLSAPTSQKEKEKEDEDTDQSDADEVTPVEAPPVAEKLKRTRKGPVEKVKKAPSKVKDSPAASAAPAKKSASKEKKVVDEKASSSAAKKKASKTRKATTKA